MGKCVSRADGTIYMENQDEKSEGCMENVKPETECAPEIEDCLNTVPLFTSLKPSERRVLGANMQEQKFSDGEKIITEGEEGDEFFIIKSGICRVLKLNEQKVDSEICQLRKGDYFGEGALLHDSLRAASIQAKGDTIVLGLNKNQFNVLFGEKRLQIKFGKRKAVSAEPYNPEKENKAEHIPADAVQTKTKDQKKLIMKVVQTNILFKGMSDDQKDQVVNHMWLKRCAKDTSIIKQGDLGDNFYVVKKGKFDIFIKKKDGKSIKVAHRIVGQSFGDLALMHNAPRAATVTALVNSELWSLDRWTFRKILTVGFRDKIKEYEDFLTQVPSFSLLLSQERSKVAEALEIVKYKKGHDIIREGEEGNTFFILKRGEVVAKKDINGEQVEVKRYSAGEFFGERALIKQDLRGATCTAIIDSECLYLGRRAFEVLLGPLEDIFRERDDNYTRVNQSFSGATGKGGGRSNKSPIMVERKRSVVQEKREFNFQTLKVIGTLGKGSFGHVQLVEDTDGSTYALKAVNKYQVVKLGQQDHIVSERKVMGLLNHPFLIKLHATHKDADNLYFLMEVCLGGELFSVLRAKTYFVESTARFFAAGVVLCFEHMHSKNIIYRDLKPENLLLDKFGYLKITDFGFAKIVHDRTWTLCGTPDYLAPEVVSGQGHGKGVDWWTLGILIYEMLASYPPFYDEDPMKTYAKIMNGKLAFPMHFSKTSVNMIRQLLRQKQSRRLGVGKGGAKLLKNHDWFKGFDWNSFLDKKMKAPIVQAVKNPHDLSNFEEYPDDDEQFPPYRGDPANPDWDRDF